MILPRPQDAIHKAWLYRLLTAFCDNRVLAEALAFKGGTCAAMLGWLDRFSVDLDFDFLLKKDGIPDVRKEMELVFGELGLEIKDKSRAVPQYFLRYPAESHQRNTIKIDATFPLPKANRYQNTRLIEIDRIVRSQTKETMFANKLVALIERYEKHTGIAGRDLYDIHHFFMNGFRYEEAVIKERRGINEMKIFFNQLIQFVDKKITATVIIQDLSTLLAPDQFRRIRKVLKDETLMLLRDELLRL